MNTIIYHPFQGANVGNGIGPAPLAFAGHFGSSPTPPPPDPIGIGGGSGGAFFIIYFPYWY